MPVQSTIDNKLYRQLLQQEKLKKTSIFYVKNRDFACPIFNKFARINSEMKKILYFILFFVVCAFDAGAASRTENTASRSVRTAATTTERTPRATTSRNAVKTTVTSRSAKNVSVLKPRTVKTPTATRTPVSRTATTKSKTITPRATTTSQVIAETRTGAEYEKCKTAFFTCMDQFCELKNDTFKRCSCNDRIFDLQDISATYQNANERLTEFTEDLDVVGMTYEQALAMKTASEGEDALTEDKSASKKLLQAIMNSIKGEDASVGGKYKDLDSITISADMVNAFGMDDSGQLIASYNGTTLYKAVYPKCRNAVKDDCNTASLQRAVNAYLMAIEQDCNSVETALANQQKSLKAATHQSSAMLDLARVENRRNHNADDVATCIANVENAVQSEQVCGANYHKCLDNGQFIDVSTGAPLTGVADFYKLGEILTFKTNVDIKDQKLSSIQNNQNFVQFFENKTKKFAQDALNRCSEDADFVWQEYLDRAMLDIYYAQQSKVKEIKQSCLTLVAKCYDDQGTAIANALANLTGDSSLLLKPKTIALTTEMCENYIDSCNGMFNNKSGDIIKEYIASKDESDSLNACRAIVQQCFDNFGGTGYSNFYSPQSGLFESGQAFNWFALYDCTSGSCNKAEIISPCAQQIVDNNPECSNKLEQIFGGFDKYDGYYHYGSTSDNPAADPSKRQIRPSGVATEVYYKIMDNLATQCAGLGGYFVEYKYSTMNGYSEDDFCKIKINSVPFAELKKWYHFIDNEDMCPANYDSGVDTKSWGACSCWENGGYRSKNGTISTCRPIIPAISGISKTEDVSCTADMLSQNADAKTPYWCQQTVFSSDGQLCPTMKTLFGTEPQYDTEKYYCASGNSSNSSIIPVVKENVSNFKLKHLLEN